MDFLKKCIMSALLCERIIYRMVEKSNDRFSAGQAEDMKMLLVLEWKQAKENLSIRWLFRVVCQNPQLTGQQSF